MNKPAGNARDRIMANIGRALNRDQPVTDAQAADLRRQAYAGDTAPRPGWQETLLERFKGKLEAQSATWVRVADTGEVPGAVAAQLRKAGLEPRFSLAAHPLLAGLDWPADMGITVGTEGIADSPVAVSVAEAGMAETGTLVLNSGPESPTTLAFLPDLHIVVLALDNLVAYQEDVWRMLQPRGDFPPRSLNFITGPSRTADVEQTIQLGAHGPRALHLIMVESKDSRPG